MSGVLAEALLALAIAEASPGKSPYSVEVMPECGRDRRAPACEVKPLCSEPSLACRAPRWSPSRRVWVRIESRNSAIKRFGTIATSIATTAGRLVSCTEERAQAGECEPIDWPNSARVLGLATLAIALHESGLRRDIQLGEPPLGRGPAREACLVQVSPRQAPLWASWVPQTDRRAIADSPRRREELAKSLLGDTPAAIERCVETGMRMLARARAACKRSRSWSYGMYSMYGSGHTCDLPGAATARNKTFQKLLAAKPALKDADREIVGWPRPKPQKAPATLKPRRSPGRS